MINGSLVNTTTFDDYFPELTWWERGLAFTYILAILIISTVGNTFVLIMSKDLKSVTKDSKGSILLVNVAFVDLMFNVVLTLPMLISSLSRTWVLGTVYCFIDAFMETYLAIVEILFVFLISLHRTIVIKFPFKQMRILNANRLYVLVMLIYVLALIPSILRTVATTQIMGYVPEDLHCDNLEVANSGPWKVLLMVSLFLYAFLPVTLTVILYGWMMCFAMSKAKLSRTQSGRYEIKGGGGTQMRGPNKAFQTVSLIVGCYLIGISLSIIVIVVSINNADVIPPRLKLVATLLWLIITAVNPIIYVFNNPIFRSHLRRIIKIKRAKHAANASSMAASMRRRITQQSIMAGSSPVPLRANSRANIYTRRSTVNLMTVTPIQSRRSTVLGLDAQRRGINVQGEPVTPVRARRSTALNMMRQGERGDNVVVEETSSDGERVEMSGIVIENRTAGASNLDAVTGDKVEGDMVDHGDKVDNDKVDGETVNGMDTLANGGFERSHEHDSGLDSGSIQTDSPISPSTDPDLVCVGTESIIIGNEAVSEV